MGLSHACRKNNIRMPLRLVLCLKVKKNLVYEVGKQIGLDLKSVGIHYNLAPLADINNNPNNPVIGYRSLDKTKKSE
jgi:beta-glucosidase-like glycosyl hydrolase